MASVIAIFMSIAVFADSVIIDDVTYNYTITDNGEKIIISFGEKSSCTVTVITSGGEKDG